MNVFHAKLRSFQSLCVAGSAAWSAGPVYRRNSTPTLSRYGKMYIMIDCPRSKSSGSLRAKSSTLKTLCSTAIAWSGRTLNVTS